MIDPARLIYDFIIYQDWRLWSPILIFLLTRQLYSPGKADMPSASSAIVWCNQNEICAASRNLTRSLSCSYFPGNLPGRSHMLFVSLYFNHNICSSIRYTSLTFARLGQRFRHLFWYCKMMQFYSGKGKRTSLEKSAGLAQLTFNIS